MWLPIPDYVVFLLLTFLFRFSQSHVIINTWSFTSATKNAYATMNQTESVLDAIVQGISVCEKEQCDYTVGYGGNPDTKGETTLDAILMEGELQETGAVGYLRHYKDAIKIAQSVLKYSQHSLLVGAGAEEFAAMMGFERSETLATDYSKRLFKEWKESHCQPNFYRSMYNSTTQCPPYKPINPFKMKKEDYSMPSYSNRQNHDTIGMVAWNHRTGEMAAGGSSNGALHKIAGRVGDVCVPGGGVYVDQRFGGAAGTGDGDVLMRYLPSYHAVTELERGATPQQACETSVRRIAQKYPHVKVGLVCLNNYGLYGAAAYGWQFTYTVQADGMNEPKIIHVEPITVLTELQAVI